VVFEICVQTDTRTQTDRNTPVMHENFIYSTKTTYTILYTVYEM